MTSPFAAVTELFRTASDQLADHIEHQSCPNLNGDEKRQLINFILMTQDQRHAFLELYKGSDQSPLCRAMRYMASS